MRGGFGGGDEAVSLFPNPGGGGRGGGEVGNRYIHILNISYYMNRQSVCSDVGSQLA